MIATKVPMFLSLILVAFIAGAKIQQGIASPVPDHPAIEAFVLTNSAHGTLEHQNSQPAILIEALSSHDGQAKDIEAAQTQHAHNILGGNILDVQLVHGNI